MPTYEYACRDCGTHVEVYQRYSDEPLKVCGVCGGELRKVFHPAGILFKGSGFYATDSRRSAASSKDGGERKVSESAGSKSEGSPGSSAASTSSAASSTTKEKSA